MLDAQRQGLSTQDLQSTGFASGSGWFPALLPGSIERRHETARIPGPAFAIDPDILLLDEPFSSLNDELRGLCRYLIDLLAQNHAPLSW